MESLRRSVLARRKSRAQDVAQALGPAASALMPTPAFDTVSSPPAGVETSLDTAGTSACATSDGGRMGGEELSFGIALVPVNKLLKSRTYTLPRRAALLAI